MGFIYSKPPCKGCEDRHTRCHSECAEYIEWSNSRQEAEAKARMKYDAESSVVGYQIDGLIKGGRRKRRELRK